MYCGLNNLGNTCYMNSLLQTLFMTREFREALFKWKYDPQKHPEKKDCIPYQLQVLFARMQEAQLKNTDAKGLVQSFQWDPQESFAQHDVQEFCRVLFDAIQQSCEADEEFINQLYQSQSQSYVRCAECQQESIRNDIFLDLSLTVKSDFNNVYNESLEKALKFYLKPEKLEGDNKYSCEVCNKKVEAIKGFRLKTISNILTIQLNRFELDMTTFDRKKVNDYVSYPFLLDMNNFLKDYNDIVIQEQKGLLEEREKLKQEFEIERATRGIEDPLKRVRPMNRKPSPGDQVKKQVHFGEETSTLQVPESLKQFQKSQLKEAQEQLDQKWQKIQSDENKKTQFTSSTIPNNPNLILTADEAYDLDNDPLFGDNVEMIEMDDMTDIPDESINKIHLTKEVTGSNLTNNNKQKIDIQDQEKLLLQQIEEESHTVLLQEQAKELLKNGPLVYELYGIMIHSGGAQGGHYYSYIKSFEDQRWYSFNDSYVENIRWTKIESMFGDKFPKYNSGVSAYFLMYRKLGDVLPKTKPQLPQQLKQSMLQEAELERQKEEKIMQERREKEMELRIRCFYKKSDSVIKVRKDCKLNYLKERIYEEFHVLEDPDNTRIRFYHQHDQLAQETFTGKEESTLQELHFNEFKSVILETKAAHEQFQEYDPHQILFKINRWRPDIESIDEVSLNPLKLFLSDDKTLDDLEEVISQKTGIPKNKLIIATRNFYNTGEFSIRVNDNTKPLGSLFLGKCPTIYVEEEIGDRSQWDIKFEDEKHKCTILFNDPRKQANAFESPDYCFQTAFDSRKTFLELKEKIADFLGLEADSFIMKRTSRMGAEIKDLTTLIKDNHIVGRGNLYLAMGKPSQKGIYKARISFGQLELGDSDAIDFHFQELFDMQVNSDWSVYELKQKICEIQSDLNPDLIRLRQRTINKLNQVYRDNDLLKQYRLFDLIHLVVERIPEKETIDSADLLMYVRFYDIKQFCLSQPQEIFIKQTTTLDELSDILGKKFNVSRDVLEGIKINNISCFTITDLVTASFDWLQLRYNQMEMGKQPWYIIKDSNFIIVRDARDVPNDMTQLRNKCDEILAKSSDPIVNNRINAPTVISSKPKEKALKITVVKKQEQQQQQQQQQQQSVEIQNNNENPEPVVDDTKVKAITTDKIESQN